MPTFTMRLPEKDHEALQAMSLLTGKPMAELVRDAIVRDVTAFAQSPETRQRLLEEQRRRETALETIAARADSEPLVTTGKI